MEQRELIEQVVDDLLTTPEVPTEGRYLSLAEAEAIVDETIDYVRNCGEAAEYVYLNGHRRRLAVSLTMIPFAESADASCLDVGCYGYMAFWAWRNLGYARVEGIEMRPDVDAPVLSRCIQICGQRLDLKIHNFNITQPEWPIQSTFDTILFLETLEHVDSDPSGVLLKVTQRMHRESLLVISVPNAVSYKTLQEFMAGAPPWVYWFFHPDLKHEPRHSFEYTPIFFKMMLRAAGLNEVAFRTICAFVERESVDDFFEIGSCLSVESSLFGETMIAQARKVSAEPLFRYPDCLYNGDSYYRTTYPKLRERMERARRAFFQNRRQLEELAGQRQAEAEDAMGRMRAEAEESARARLEAEDLVRRVRAEAEDLARRARAEAEESARARAEAEESVRLARADAETATMARRHADTVAMDATARSREAMFLCETYFEKLRANEAARLQLIGDLEALRAKETAAMQRMADREAHLRKKVRAKEAARMQLVADLGSAEQRAARALRQYKAIERSTFWRVTGPARRVCSRYPKATARLRAIVGPMARACRGLLRRREAV